MTEVRWRVKERQYGQEWDGPLVAYWEVSEERISDNYTPSDIDAEELLGLWVARAEELFPNGLVPISWFAACDEQRKFEAMPFQFSHYDGLTEDDFLTYYRWPVHPETGERLNWMSLPVKD